ncbi:MAG TPA: hypothetical protein VF499_16205 [Afipia sp.]
MELDDLPELPLKKQKNLSNSLRSLKGLPGQGLCFHRSVALLMDQPTAKLVIGTIREASKEELKENPLGATEPFLHCWTEIGDQAYVATLIEANGGLFGIPAHVYREANGATNVEVFPRKPVMDFAKANSLSDYFRVGGDHPARPDFVPRLFDAIGFDPTDKGTITRNAD